MPNETHDPDARDNTPEDEAAIQAVVDKAAATKAKAEEKAAKVEAKKEADAAKAAAAKAKIKAALDEKAAKDKAKKDKAKADAKAKKDAERAKAKAKKDAEKAAKVKTDEQKAAEKAVLVATETKALAPIAREINVRLEKAAKLEDDADDHRLAAALQLKVAADKCSTTGLNFKEWAAANLTQSYETIRKMVAVGKADNPALALADMRGKNKEANKALREKKAAELKELKEANAGKGHQPSDDGEGTGGGARTVKDAVILVGLPALQAAFKELRAADQMAFVEWAALEIGAKLDTGFGT